MRLAFCFSRSCKPYPTILALRSLPCCPGAKLRFSTGHLSLKHFVPFRNSFMPSRRHRRHTASLYRANLFSLFGVDWFTRMAPLLPSPKSFLFSFSRCIWPRLRHHQSVSVGIFHPELAPGQIFRVTDLAHLHVLFQQALP